MKKLIFATAILCTLGLAWPPQCKSTLASAEQPSYVLRAWQIDGGDQHEYLWSLEGQDHGDSTGTLYKSLRSPSLRARISVLPAGATLTLHWGQGGAIDKDSESRRLFWNKELEDFTAFCESKRVSFNYLITTN